MKLHKPENSKTNTWITKKRTTDLGNLDWKKEHDKSMETMSHNW